MLLQFKFDPDKPFFIEYNEYHHNDTGAIQIVNEKTAAAVAQDILTAKAEGAPGLPIYQRHPDVPGLAADCPNKAAVGWITELTQVDGGFELQPEWITQPKPGEFIYFSPYFGSPATKGQRKQIDEIKSIGLTNTPNDTRFRLPNEAATTKTKKGDNTMDMKAILEALGLPEGASVEDAVAAIKALGGTANEETEDLKEEVKAKEAEAAAAKKEAEKAKEQFANERSAHVGVLLDNAIADGRITPAQRPGWQERLGKRESFANESKSLSKLKPAVKTRSAFANEDLDEREGFANEAACLDHYNSMPAGKEKSAFLHKHAEAINSARVARRNSAD